MTMITPSYLGETIEYSSLHACRSTLEDPTNAITWLFPLQSCRSSQCRTCRVRKPSARAFASRKPSSPHLRRSGPSNGGRVNPASAHNKARPARRLLRSPVSSTRRQQTLRLDPARQRPRSPVRRNGPLRLRLRPRLTNRRPARHRRRAGLRPIRAQRRPRPCRPARTTAATGRSSRAPRAAAWCAGCTRGAAECRSRAGPSAPWDSAAGYARSSAPSPGRTGTLAAAAAGRSGSATAASCGTGSRHCQRTGRSAHHAAAH